MQIINDTLVELMLGDPAVCRNLAVFPLFGKKGGEPDYLTLEEALERGGVVVTEISEGGSVPELRLENKTDVRVLLVDGEELVGAKQNRVLNVSVLIGAHKTVTIPVSCVEVGRWSYTSRRFAAGQRIAWSTLRAKVAASVNFALGSEFGHRSNQAEVWAEIAEKMGRMCCASPTEAMDALYEDQAGRIEEYQSRIRAGLGRKKEGAQRQEDVEAIGGLARQLAAGGDPVGAVFAVNGRVVGVELFDCAATFAKFLDRLVTSYAMDAIDLAEVVETVPPAALVRAWLERLGKARQRMHPAVDLGEDVRFAEEDLAGGALIADGRVVHLSAFCVERPV